MPSSEPRLDGKSCEALRELARRSVEAAARGGQEVDVDASLLPPALRESAASFVTLRCRGRLRGCIGSLEPLRPLAADVAANAFAAATRDPRFPVLVASELAALEIQVSVLGPLERLGAESEPELASALRPCRDGLLLRSGGREATFLPSVWESLEEPRLFIRELLRKAGVPAGDWPRGLVAFRYAVQAIAPIAAIRVPKAQS